MKPTIAKAVLWSLVGFGATIIVLRLLHGPGSVTELSDIIPWGLWKGGGVVALVAMGGAGFTLAMFVYVFGWSRYEPVLRGAVLLALMCYTSVAVGLTFDIGIWWRIVFPLVHWQLDSVLFEVAWCIMLYLGVLTFEFGHTVMERMGWNRLLHVAEKATLVFVIAGISLSTLHQSSLGTLFLATPFRLHPLWHTDLLPLLFFMSAIGIGCLTISLVTLAVHWLYDAAAPMDAVSGLARIGGFVLAAYGMLRLAEIGFAGEAPLLFVASWDTFNFWLELTLSSALPAVLLGATRLRHSPRSVFWIALLATLGLSLNRVSVAGLATVSLTHATYVPSWMEWALTASVLAGAALVYLFAVEHLHLFASIRSGRSRADRTPGAQRRAAATLEPGAFLGPYLLGQSEAGPRLYSWLFVTAASLALALAPPDAIGGVRPQQVAVSGPRVVEVIKTQAASGQGTRFVLPGPATHGGPAMAETSVVTAMMIDGNRDGRYVLFDHDAHARRLEAEEASSETCATCHHMALPYEKAGSCAACHSDMYEARDIFNHSLHEQQYGGNEGCATCHGTTAQVKTRADAKACGECHGAMIKSTEYVDTRDLTSESIAAGYMDAMHGLCVTCHEKRGVSVIDPQREPGLCTDCHQALPDLDEETWTRRR